MGGKKEEKIRVSITLREDVYEQIKDLSHDLGIKPTTWITMAVTSQVRGIKLSLEKSREK
jgi:hypothetical protein